MLQAEALIGRRLLRQDKAAVVDLSHACSTIELLIDMILGVPDPAPVQLAVRLSRQPVHSDGAPALAGLGCHEPHLPGAGVLRADDPSRKPPFRAAGIAEIAT